MKNYNNFILEKIIRKENIDVIYNKYYKNIDYKIFKEIISSDPTSWIDGNLYFGKYCKWLLNLYKSNKLKLEDLYKVKDYIELFNKQSLEINYPLIKEI